MLTKFEERAVLERDSIVLANARRLIRAANRTTNSSLYMQLFGTGFGTAQRRCEEYFGLDPHGFTTSYNEMMEFIAHRYD